MCRELAQQLYGHNVVPRERKSGGGRPGARPKLKDPERLRPGVPSDRVDVRVAVVWVELAPSASPVGPLVLLGIEVRRPVHAAILSYHPAMGYFGQGWAWFTEHAGTDRRGSPEQLRRGIAALADAFRQPRSG